MAKAKVLKPKKSVRVFFADFLRQPAAGGVILVVCAAVAMLLANSRFAEAYAAILHYPLGVDLFGFSMKLSVELWINDALMVIFFYIVGMEIKNELIRGALASFDRAALPVAAALGGMVVPALIFLMIGPTGPAARGWGIPMATDIAFAIGVIALLGKRVPVELKVFLLALAIADDLGAVLVIAVFYTANLSVAMLGIAAALCVAIWALAKRGIRSTPLFVLLGVGVWLAVFRSGIHATISGVILGFMMPSQRPSADQESPIEYWAHKLSPYSTFAIMPIFALANAGVQLGDLTLEVLFKDPLVSGVSYGLLIGKPVGIVAAVLISTRLKLARLPQGVSMPQIIGVGCIAGIGFTMALFVATLAMTSPEDLGLAKVGIIKGSLTSAIVGSLILYFVKGKSNDRATRKSQTRAHSKT